MYHAIDDFTKDWRYESEATLKMLRLLTDESLTQCVTPAGRTLGRIAWHLVQSIADFGRRALLPTTGPSDDAPIPGAAEIADQYERAARSIATAVTSQWADGMLPDEIEVFGQRWPRGALLASLIRHQAHHRGQLTVLMRQASLDVPGVYGPSRDEWTAYGREPEP